MSKRAEDSQAEKFKKAAREAEADESEEAFDSQLKRVAKRRSVPRVARLEDGRADGQGD